MSSPTDENNFLHELKVVVAIALTTAEASHSQNPRDLSVTEWLFDPIEIERERVGLRGILAAITELENGSLFRPATEDRRNRPSQPSPTDLSIRHEQARKLHL
ncbi:hypothetical protein ACIBQX_36875 [Nonomuraea sp. NPDC049714]|uniref:hypothetical protein n=1 Tax=Nonomuraea sp. NPDC049714 TaxID=3364357 RepID=UPI0037A6F98B